MRSASTWHDLFRSGMILKRVDELTRGRTSCGPACPPSTRVSGLQGFQATGEGRALCGGTRFSIAGQKAVAVKRRHLFISKAILLPVLFMRGQGPQRASGCMQLREVLHHGTLSLEWDRL